MNESFHFFLHRCNLRPSKCMSPFKSGVDEAGTRWMCSAWAFELGMLFSIYECNSLPNATIWPYITATVSNIVTSRLFSYMYKTNTYIIIKWIHIYQAEKYIICKHNQLRKDEFQQMCLIWFFISTLWAWSIKFVFYVWCVFR